MAAAEIDIDSCMDEEVLTKLLASTENFDKRKQIRNRMKFIRENESKAFADKRKEREEQGVVKDFTAMRLASAEAERMKKLKDYQEQAKENSIGAVCKEDFVAVMHERNAQEKQAQMKMFNEMAKEGGPGVFQDGLEVVKRIDHEAKLAARQRELDQFDQMAKHVDKPSTVPVGDYNSKPSFVHHLRDEYSNGQLTTKISVVSTNESDDELDQQYDVSWGKNAPPQGARGAMNAFKKMDKAANPDGGSAKPNLFMLVPKMKQKAKAARSANEIKMELMQFCQEVTKHYENEGVKITNFSGSWADGLAFCALIHHFYPESFDFSQLSPKNRAQNFQLAFDTAEKLANIAPLLEVGDMVAMKVPDWKCVFTYVQSFYRRFRLDPRYNKPEKSTTDENVPEESDEKPNPFVNNDMPTAS